VEHFTSEVIAAEFQRLFAEAQALWCGEQKSAAHI
jgi:hypothetical protein